MKLKVKYMRTSNVEPLEVREKGEWVDLRLAEDATLKKGEYKLLPLGIRMELPEGFEAHIVARSSTPEKYKILQANAFGVIDSTYKGPKDQWGMPVLAFEDTEIQKGTRICQFRIMPSQFASSHVKYTWMLYDGVEFIEEEWLEGNEESRGGFGSTGEK